MPAEAVTEDMEPVRNFECNTPDVVFENFGDEVILLNLKTGAYYSLNESAMACWELLSQGVATADAAKDALTFYQHAANGSDIPNDVQRLAGQLVSEQLLRPSAVAADVGQISRQTSWPANYAAPTITKFEDVADLLLLDPVHDVSDAGWPHPAPSAAAERENARAHGA